VRRRGGEVAQCVASKVSCANHFLKLSGRSLCKDRPGEQKLHAHWCGDWPQPRLAQRRPCLHHDGAGSQAFGYPAVPHGGGDAARRHENNRDLVAVSPETAGHRERWLAVGFDGTRHKLITCRSARRWYMALPLSPRNETNTD